MISFQIAKLKFNVTLEDKNRIDFFKKAITTLPVTELFPVLKSVNINLRIDKPKYTFNSTPIVMEGAPSFKIGFKDRFFATVNLDGQTYKIDLILKKREYFELFITTLLTLLLPETDAIILHSASIKYKNKVIIFSGKSETGKTTTANLFCNLINGAKIFSIDRGILMVEKDKLFYAPLPIPQELKEEQTIYSEVHSIIFPERGKQFEYNLLRDDKYKTIELICNNSVDIKGNSNYKFLFNMAFLIAEKLDSAYILKYDKDYHINELKSFIAQLINQEEKGEMRSEI